MLLVYLYEVFRASKSGNKKEIGGCQGLEQDGGGEKGADWLMGTGIL